MWYVYILECADSTLYTGITKNIIRRLNEHNTSPIGAKYTRARRPVRLVFLKEMNSKAEAQREEYRIKKLSRKEKLDLIAIAKNSPEYPLHH